jgi:DNA-directed RNA polymerase specialized sigma24 family protein
VVAEIHDAGRTARGDEMVPRAIAGNLFQRFRSGDTAAFEEVYREHFPIVCGFLRRKYSARLASDCIEQAALDSFVRAWQHCAKFDEAKGTLRTWLCTIADHEAARFYRSTKVKLALPEHAVGRGGLADVTDPDADNRVAEDELLALVHEALDAIPADFAQLLWADACQLSGRSPGTQRADKPPQSAALRQRKHRAKLLLRDELLRRGVQKYLRHVTKTVTPGYTLMGGVEPSSKRGTDRPRDHACNSGAADAVVSHVPWKSRWGGVMPHFK